jgi:hypothetical protein
MLRMSESNGYCVLGTLLLLQNDSITAMQATETVNMWIELSARKGYAEGVLDGKRSNAKISKERDEKASYERLKDLGIDSY